MYGFLKLHNNGPVGTKFRNNFLRKYEACNRAWLQVHGRALAISSSVGENSSQHIGFGRRLMKCRGHCETKWLQENC